MFSLTHLLTHTTLHVLVKLIALLPATLTTAVWTMSTTSTPRSSSAAHAPKTPRHKASKASSATYALNQKEIQAAYRTPRKGKKRSCPSSLSANKDAASAATPSAAASTSSVKKSRPATTTPSRSSTKKTPMSLAYIWKVFSLSPRPPSDISTWTTADDIHLRQCLQDYYNTGAFGKCDWAKIFKSFEGKHRETALKARWTQLRDAYEWYSYVVYSS